MVIYPKSPFRHGLSEGHVFCRVAAMVSRQFQTLSHEVLLTEVALLVGPWAVDRDEDQKQG